jgi:hypothetical protein
VYEQEDITVMWNEAVYTEKEFTVNRPDIIIKNKKKENTHADRCGKTQSQKCYAKGRGKEAKIQEFMNRDKMNVKPEM